MALQYAGRWRVVCKGDVGAIGTRAQMNTRSDLSNTARPSVLDLFAGVGGLGLGFEQAGFDVAAAVELDPIHAATHSVNFPKCQTICADATLVRGTDIHSRSGRDIDVVVGGAPCQGFSLIGQRSLDDPRNQLVRHYLRLVIELRPKVFVLENVKGLTLGKHRRFLDELVSEFVRQGYAVRLPWEVLNARDYGVPQDRRRLFLIGARDDIELPLYPNFELFANSPTCEDALADLPDADDFDPLKFGDTASIKLGPSTTLSVYARHMRCLDNDSWHYGHVRYWDPSLLTASARTEHTSISKRRFAETVPGTVEPISRFFKLDRRGVSNTLRAGTDSSRGAFTSPRPIHYEHNRCITVREMARLHGFPDWFRFHVTKWHGARQVGNAVPPPLARAVARSVREALGVVPSRPEGMLDMGDERLLSMDMTQAANYWSVEVPIGRRDRKSGAKKRKQADIERERASAVL